MSSILSCRCGAKIRVPDGAEGKAVRCPKCRSELVVAAGAAIVASTVATGGEAGATCPICQTEIGSAEPVVSCPSCHQAHHRDCWAEVGGCSTYGCDRAPQAAKQAPAGRPLAAWGDTKRCPACGESIKAIALRCRYCGQDFDTVDPLTVRDLKERVRSEDARGIVQNATVALFVVSLVGCLAPIALVAGLAIVLPNRRLLARSGPFYLLLGYSAIGLSALYSILMVGFALFGGSS